MCNKTIDDIQLQSKTISFLRFPLIVLVVFAHSYFRAKELNPFNNDDITIYNNISFLLSSIIGKIATPLFFFISGFLFFYKNNIFTSQTYLTKLKKRIRGILIPYIFWNLLVIAYYFFLQTTQLGEAALKEKHIIDYTITDWFYAFWNTYMINPLSTPTIDDAVAYPMCYQFWFLRDLMVISLLSPLIYMTIKKCHIYSILILCLLWIMNWWTKIPGFSIISVFFFSAGAYFSIQEKNFVSIFKKRFYAIAIVYLILISTMLVFKNHEDIIFYLARINRIIGPIFAITISAHLIQKYDWFIDKRIEDSNFFIYAYHGLALSFISKRVYEFIHPQSDIALSITYILNPIITVILGICIYLIIKRYLPKLTALITGGR